VNQGNAERSGDTGRATPRARRSYTAITFGRPQASSDAPRGAAPSAPKPTGHGEAARLLVILDGRHRRQCGLADGALEALSSRRGGESLSVSSPKDYSRASRHPPGSLDDRRRRSSSLNRYFARCRRASACGCNESSVSRLSQSTRSSFKLR